MRKMFIFILMMLPVVTFAETCEMVNDNQTGNNRNLVCDETLRTTTSFKTTKEEQVLKNSVCTVTCTEEIVVSIDPIKKVLAGMGFNYPLYVSGERKCKAVYNYSAYESKIKTLVDQYASLTGVSKQTKANEITNYYAEKKACDEFYKSGSDYEKKYGYDGDVTLKVETSTKEVTIPYEFQELEEYSSSVIVDEINYTAACDYNESGRTCSIGKKTVAGWTETARIFGKYTMADSYLENYTGDVKDVAGSDTCNAGDRFFTDFNELTRPVENDTTDKGYKLTLTARELGNNLVLTGDRWNLDVDCWYQVKNLMFPQNNVGGNTDDNFDDYGGTAFQYRIIDVKNPFPNREAGANWKGKEKLITDTADRLSSLQKFVITLDRSSINKIREYNDVHKYDTFNLNEMEKSSFIEANPNIIDRK